MDSKAVKDGTEESKPTIKLLLPTPYVMLSCSMELITCQIETLKKFSNCQKNSKISKESIGLMLPSFSQVKQNLNNQLSSIFLTTKNIHFSNQNSNKISVSFCRQNFQEIGTVFGLINTKMSTSTGS